MDTCLFSLDQEKDRATLFNRSCLGLYVIAFSGFGAIQRRAGWVGSLRLNTQSQ